MISFHTKINGQDFEIEVADGLTIELSDNKLTVKGIATPLKSALPEVHYHYHYPQAQPYWNQLPVTVNPHPFIGPGNISVTYGNASTDSEQNNSCLHHPLSITQN